MVSTFTVWRFNTDAGAQRAVHPLARWRSAVVRIDDAAVVSWPAGRPRPVAWQAHDLAGPQPLAGAFWALLVSLLFLLPLTRSEQGADAGPADSGADTMGPRLSRLGFDDHFACTVQAQITAGTSGLFLLSTGENGADLGQAAPPGAQEIVRIALDADQAADLHAAFDG